MSGLSVECCAGPSAEGIWRAQWSLTEALVLESFPESTPNPGRVGDASDHALERLAAKFGHREDLDHFITEQLENLLQCEDQPGNVLLATLLVWLDAGCNATNAAHQLYLERQSLHKRLARIFALLGGDLHEGGRLLRVHLARWLAMGRPQHVRTPRVGT
ncbi:PucR family transcriptional regulator [Glutamicibacter sp. HZAU]|uniref:PucR family transcriptional regulator n=1 Tax=Glutamicibacter sp. HZAU TaxID=2049891 RepID=UPI001375A4CE|nr:helix-turn-helix domain-containing protein [Glutamicibacter sp. HZAU]